MSALFPNPGGNLDPSKLSDQLETLSDDLTVRDFNLQVTSEHAKHIVRLRESITDVQIARTIQGASTITATVEDRDAVLLRSGMFGQSLTLSRREKTILGQGISFVNPVDLELDGLWFRLVQVTKQDPRDRTLTLVFEDREVALLRSYPKKGTAYYSQVRRYAATEMPRAKFMQMLVAEVSEIRGGIRLHCPMLSETSATPIKAASQTLDPNTRRLTHHPGFPPKPKFAVQRAPADPTQIDNLQAVLDVGVSMNATQKVMLAALETVIQESNARTSATNGTHVGLFQQDSYPGSAWVMKGGATRSPQPDAHAFFSTAQDKIFPTTTPDALALAVQAPGGSPRQYGQWKDEADTILGLYFGTVTLASVGGAPVGVSGPAGSVPGPAGVTEPRTGGAPDSPGSPYVVPSTPFVDLSGSFTQGTLDSVTGRRQFVRENNWACLQRLGLAVGWRVFCVSGTIYITTDKHLTEMGVAFTVSEQTPGVDGIGFSVDTGKARATLTVACRASRWQAAPGNMVKVEGEGPADGRWLVNTIERSLTDPDTTITLAKPQPALADDAAESANAVKAAPQTYAASGVAKAYRQAVSTIQTDVTGVRAAIVAAGQKAFANRQNYPYDQFRPIPKSLFGPPPVLTDCSSFVTLCYQAGDAPDPNGNGYNGSGNTKSLIEHGTKTASPQAADLLFINHDGRRYIPGDTPDHVVLWVGDGNGTVISQSSHINDLLRYTMSAVDLASSTIAGFYTYNLGPLAR